MEKNKDSIRRIKISYIEWSTVDIHKHLNGEIGDDDEEAALNNARNYFMQRRCRLNDGILSEKIVDRILVEEA